MPGFFVIRIYRKKAEEEVSPSLICWYGPGLGF